MTSWVGPASLQVSATYAGSINFDPSFEEIQQDVDPPAAPRCSSALGRGTVVGMAVTPTGDGYWITSSTGAVAACGDAPNLGQERPGRPPSLRHQPGTGTDS